MAPEFIESRQLSVKSDVFAFGVCLLKTIMSMLATSTFDREVWVSDMVTRTRD